jgi:hypothetical protein
MVQVMEKLLEGGNFDGLSREDANRLKNQLNAALAREAKLKGKSFDSQVDNYRLGDVPKR